MKTLPHKISYATDEEVIEKILDGETMFFEVLIRRYNPLLYKIARSYGFTHHDAEDLMQESHFSAFMQLKTFRRKASYKTWLTKIHLNWCYHKLNSGASRYEEVRDVFATDQSSLTQPAGDSVTTENIVVNKELGKVLEESLRQIPLSYRNVFVLREIEGFNVAETAELLGITPVNVKVRLNRSKAMLQKQLEKVYSASDLYEFHLKYCDKIVNHVFERIAALSGI